MLLTLFGLSCLSLPFRFIFFPLKNLSPSFVFDCHPLFLVSAQPSPREYTRAYQQIRQSFEIESPYFPDSDHPEMRALWQFFFSPTSRLTIYTCRSAVNLCSHLRISDASIVVSTGSLSPFLLKSILFCAFCYAMSSKSSHLSINLGGAARAGGAFGDHCWQGSHCSSRTFHFITSIDNRKLWAPTVTCRSRPLIRLFALLSCFAILFFISQLCTFLIYIYIYFSSCALGQPRPASSPT